MPSTTTTEPSPMPPPHNDAVNTPPAASLRSTLKVQWPSLLRHGLQVCVFNTVVAIVQIVMARNAHWDIELVYSQAIGLSIWAFIDIGRFILTGDSVTGWPSGRRGIALVAGGIVGGFIVGASIGDLYSGGSTFAGLSLMSGKTRQLLGSIGATLVAGTIGTTYFYSRARAQYLRAQAAATERDLAETRLKLLESQLEPHMLFNTLANLRVLIALDPDRAQAMLDRLIAFLRATLSASRAATHPLRDEFARVDDYLSLMKVRMGDRLVATLSLPEALANLAVPSLLLQPLVENAIKHGLEPHVDGGLIEVSAAQAGDDLVLTVCDSGAGLVGGSHTAAGDSDGTIASDAVQAAGSHFGLVQVRQRLGTLYGDSARLELRDRASTSIGGVDSSVDGSGGPNDGAAQSGTVAVVTIALSAIARAGAASVDRQAQARSQTTSVDGSASPIASR